MMYGAVHGWDVRELSTKHVVLGLLIERRGYAYEIEKRFNERFGFLGRSEKVVYRAIDTLRREGLIESVGPKQTRGRTERGAPKIVYRPTVSGSGEFQRWLAEPCEIGVAQEEVHVKLVLSRRPDDLPLVIELAERLERSCLAEMQEIQAAMSTTLDQLTDPDIPWGTVSSVLVDDAECIRLQGIIDWLQHVRVVARRRLERLQQAGVLA